MNAKTLKALKGSIEKWEKIVNETGKDSGWTNCPLCDLFLHSEDCRHCPIFEKTNQSYCKNTPYTTWEAHQEKKHDEEFPPYIIQCPTCKKLAQKEVDFLKSLLPKREKS